MGHLKQHVASYYRTFQEILMNYKKYHNVDNSPWQVLCKGPQIWNLIG